MLESPPFFLLSNMQTYRLIYSVTFFSTQPTPMLAPRIGRALCFFSFTFFLSLCILSAPEAFLSESIISDRFGGCQRIAKKVEASVDIFFDSFLCRLRNILHHVGIVIIRGVAEVLVYWEAVAFLLSLF